LTVDVLRHRDVTTWPPPPSLAAVLMTCESTRGALSNTSVVGWLGSRVVSVLDSGAVVSGFKSQPQRCRVTVLGKLFTPIVLLFTKQRNW